MPATVVLVHGAWHGAWCWDRVVDGLRERDIDALALDLPGHGDSSEPLGDLYGDAAALRGTLDTLDGPAVVCGHSYGGAVVSLGAASHPAAKHLVFLAALMLDAGESCAASVPEPPGGAPGPELELGRALRFSDDGTTITLDLDVAPGAFYADCSPSDTAWAVERLGGHPAASLRQTIDTAAWRDIPSTYVICEDDRALPVWLQRVLSERATNVVTWPTSHSPFLSRPELVVDLLADLV
jgi:pimeloyl-ACP methyl ester carboxylesterase